MGFLNRSHITDKLVAYIHDELPPGERTRVVAHLETCEMCRAALVEEEALAAQLAAQLPPLTHPRPGQLMNLWPAIAARLGESKLPRTNLAHKSIFGMALTASLLCMLLVPLLLGGRVPSSRAAADSAMTQPAYVFGTGPTLPAGAATAVTSLPGSAVTATSTWPDSTSATVTPVPTPDAGG